jgi:glycosyltransferase involved in cell wall biosynthesis
VSSQRASILYIAPWVDLGGSDKGTIDWFKHIDRQLWAPSLITTQPSPNRWLHKVAPFAEEIWELPDLMPGPSFPEFILGFIESREVRVVHIMNSRLGFDLLPDIACLPQPPAIVAQMHAEEPNQAGYVRYATKRYGNLIDAFSVTSQHLKETLVSYEIPPSRIEVIHSGVDAEDEFNPGHVERLPLAEVGVPRILWPGRLVEQKDPMLTLEALALARRRGAEFVLDVVGDGHMKRDLEICAERLGVAEVINWHPPSQEMPRWYRSADLLLMTSLYEGVPYVIYESLAMGVPVVAPAIPGNLEFMNDENGLLIEPRDDANGYAEAIVALLGDRKRRIEMGERSRQRMLTKFSLESMGQRHDRLYERLLGVRSASSRWREEGLGGASSAGEPAALPAPLSLPRDPRPEATVSVGVPCFRHGIFLDQCIRSIKGQTLLPRNIVIVDDGSDDPETIEALERWERDPEVTVLRQPVNLGPSAARNRALELFDTNYALWIDADDLLLPGALDSMVAKLEGAPAHIGFIYPHAQHTGNRADYVEMPAYNLWLLMQENYCPSPALFDRRVFDEARVSYQEDLVVGHEDWDLILQLAEHGIHGLHADGPTFLYRKQGFSRISAADYGPHDFHEAIEQRHPALYRNRDKIKAKWAPALSIVLIDEGDAVWSDSDLLGLDGQTCGDFETLAAESASSQVRVVETDSSGQEPWLQTAIREARGRWVCLLTPSTAPLLANPSFVEQLLRAFTAHDDVVAIALGEATGIVRHALSQLSDTERLSAQPRGLAFARPAGGSMPKVDLGDEASALVDLVLGLQPNGIVQWRLAPPGERSANGGTPEKPPVEGLRLNLDRRRAGDRSEAAVQRSLAVQKPLLPRLTPGTVRRWEGAPGWAPPGTMPLCRHVELGGERRVVTNDREPPPGYETEFELGVVQMSASPGTQRLVHRAGTFELSNDQNALSEGRGLGYVEEQPLPQHDRLELREMPDSGERVLVAGPYDPLFEIAKPIALLGWIDLFPILPRGALLHTGPWAAVVLRRSVDIGRGRHRYRIDPPGERSEGIALGSVFAESGRNLVALRCRDDGRLVSDLAQPGRTSRDPRKLLRWLAGSPAGGQGEDWSKSARLRHLARNRDGRRQGGGEGVTLGWLRRQGARESRPLFSTTHPITGDQLVTCDPHEAVALGYLPDGVLGFILDAGTDYDPASPPYRIPWAAGGRSA